MQAPIVSSPSHGDYFVVLSKAGYWTGEEWAEDWKSALRFEGPICPFEACQELCDALSKQFGLDCGVAYIPLPKIGAPQPPNERGVRLAIRRKNPHIFDLPSA